MQSWIYDPNHGVNKDARDPVSRKAKIARAKILQAEAEAQKREKEEKAEKEKMKTNQKEVEKQSKSPRTPVANKQKHQKQELTPLTVLQVARFTSLLFRRITCASFIAGSRLHPCPRTISAPPKETKRSPSSSPGCKSSKATTNTYKQFQK